MSTKSTVASVVDWVNSGFNGKPAFITDYDQYFKDAEDQAASGFIDEGNFAQLCQPLQTPVRFIVDLAYKQARDYGERSQCTADAANDASFVQGNFESGGWSAWFSIVSNPSNNIYGAAAIAKDEGQNRDQQAIDVARTEALAGGGFLSDKRCGNVSRCPASARNGAPPTKCRI